MEVGWVAGDLRTCATIASSASCSRKMASVIKESTKVTGLLVCNNPKHLLNRLYSGILLLLERMPPQSGYRKYTEDIVKQRAAIINSTEDIKVMEDKIGCGQIEELIQQARNELELSRRMLVASPWESLKTPAPANQWKWPVK